MAEIKYIINMSAVRLEPTICERAELLLTQNRPGCHLLGTLILCIYDQLFEASTMQYNPLLQN